MNYCKSMAAYAMFPWPFIYLYGFERHGKVWADLFLGSNCRKHGLISGWTCSLEHRTSNMQPLIDLWRLVELSPNLKQQISAGHSVNSPHKCSICRIAVGPKTRKNNLALQSPTTNDFSQTCVDAPVAWTSPCFTPFVIHLLVDSLTATYIAIFPPVLLVSALWSDEL